MLRTRARLVPSPLTPSGTGRESFKVQRSEIADIVTIRFYPETYDGPNKTFIEFSMDKRTAAYLAHALTSDDAA